MKTKIIAVVVIVAALGVVFWLKTQKQSGAETPEPKESEVLSTSKVEPRASVILFADPREEDADCGCADIIRIARATSEIPGVTYREFDSRNSSEESEKYKIRISPTLILYDAKNEEIGRFEGESKAVVGELETALAQLKIETPSK